MKHKPGETIEEFVARLRPVIAHLGYDDLAIYDPFLAALSEKVEEQLIMAGGDLANATNIAQRYYNLLESRQVSTNEFCKKAFVMIMAIIITLP